MRRTLAETRRFRVPFRPMKSILRLCVAVAPVLAFATTGGEVLAQGTPTPTPSAAPASAQSADAVERARTYYERGLQLFAEENYDAALFEFERAYELAPSFKILYNMGRIQRQQNNYAAALRSYERYLREGGANVPKDRRAEVEKDMGVLRPRVAEVTVKVNVDNADVYADDIPVCTATIESTCVGKSPLRAPIIMNGGRHKITATKRGFVTATSLISVVGSDKIDVKLELVSLERKEEPKNVWVVPAIVGWTATGLAFIGAGVFGGLSLHAKNQQQDLLKTFGTGSAATTQGKLDDARHKTDTLSHVTDGLWIAGAAFAVASGYFTYRMIGTKRDRERSSPPPPAAAFNRPTLDVSMNPGGFAAVGTF